MKPTRWEFPVELSKREETLLKRLKKRPFYGFLRRIRHELFNDAFQNELSAMYAEEEAVGGRPGLPPAFLAMVVLLQAYTGLSDGDAVDAAIVDLRWLLVLGLLNAAEDAGAPYSQGTLVNFRARLMAHGLDRRLLERTVELAKETGEFGYKNLRLALDSSPLFTAGRVEDAFNLLGHAARKVIALAAALRGQEPEDLAIEAGIPVLAADPAVSGGSLKARLDVDWGRPEERAKAFVRLVSEVRALKAWLEDNGGLQDEPLASRWAVVEELLGQDVEPDPDTGAPRVKQGTAPERRPSVEDGEARHGRKSKSQKFVGYKRTLGICLDTGLVLAVHVAPANKPEGAAARPISRDLSRYGGTEAESEEAALSAVAEMVSSVSVDMAYLSSDLVKAAREAGKTVLCKAFPQRGKPGMYTKADFALSLPDKTLTCPAGTIVAAQAGAISRFPAKGCNACPLKARCTSSASGRCVSIHSDEAFLLELRARQQTSEGRAELRQRTAIEHTIARQVSVQGRKARYKGVRKNLFAARAATSIVNLMTIDHDRRQRASA